jgi:hypothetical protein
MILDAQEKKLTSSELLEMEESKSFLVISKMNKEDVASLITQIRSDVRKEYKNIDKFYLLISHLESIKAIEEEQARLKSLNLVYILGLILILLIFAYIIFSQRAALKKIETLLK